MPIISRFYGLIIKMFFVDHAPPHIHVVYGENNAVFDISTCKMTAGDLPYKGQKMTEEWLNLHKAKGL